MFSLFLQANRGRALSGFAKMTGGTVLAAVGLTIGFKVYLAEKFEVNFVPSVIAPLPPPAGKSGPIRYLDVDVREGKVSYELEANSSVTLHFTDINKITVSSSRGTFSSLKLNNVPLSSCSDFVQVRHDTENSFRIYACSDTARLLIEGFDTTKPIYDTRTISPNEVDRATLTENTTLTVEMVQGANQLNVTATRGSFNIFGAEGAQLNMFCTSNYTARAGKNGKGFIRPCNGSADVELRGWYVEPPQSRQTQPAIVVDSVPRTQPYQNPYYSSEDDRPHVYSRPGVDGSRVVATPGVGQ